VAKVPKEEARLKPRVSRQDCPCLVHVLEAIFISPKSHDWMIVPYLLYCSWHHVARLRACLHVIVFSWRMFCPYPFSSSAVCSPGSIDGLSSRGSSSQALRRPFCGISYVGSNRSASGYYYISVYVAIYVFMLEVFLGLFSLNFSFYG
jgi:hypothetical protein